MAKTVKLVSIAKVIMGQSPPGNTYNEIGEGLPLLNGPTEFGMTSPECTLFTTDSRRDCEPGDLIFCVRGSTTGRMNWADRKYSLGRGVCSLRGASLLETRFIRYCIEDKLHALLQLSGGGTFPNLTKDVIEQFEIPWPDNRSRLAGILSAYDELIENNQKRIKILETMARNLYREWFVHFRFPGHQNVELVPSPLGPIPKGWEVTTLGEQLATLESGKRPRGGIRDVQDGVPSIGAENINGIGRHDFVSEKFVPREFFQKMYKGVVRNGDVAIYKDGAYIGRSSYFRDSFPHAECCVNEHVFLLRSNGVRIRQNALYLWLQEPDTVRKIRTSNANAAQPGINQQSVNSLELVVPDKKMAAQFDHLAEPLFAELITLAKQIQNLRRTRDLLLPRLLSDRGGK